MTQGAQQGTRTQQVATRPAALPPMQLARFGETLDLTAFPSDKYNNLSPYETITPLSPLHMVSVQAVRISVNSDDEEVYKGDGSGQGQKWRLAKRGLLRLGAAAGLIWETEQCRLVLCTETRAIYQAVGYVIQPDGSTRWIKGTKDINLAALEEEITDQQAFRQTHVWDKQADQYVLKHFPGGETEKQRAIDAAIRKELGLARKFMIAKAETGAYLRAIRAVTTVKGQYRLEELAKPFVCVRVSLNPMADAELSRDIARQTAGISLAHAPRIAQPTMPALLNAPDIAGIEEGPDAEEEVYQGDIPEDAPGEGRLL